MSADVFPRSGAKMITATASIAGADLSSGGAGGTTIEIWRVRMARTTGGGHRLDADTLLLDELRIEIGSWLADRTKDHETLRAIGRLLGVDMGGE